MADVRRKLAEAARERALGGGASGHLVGTGKSSQQRQREVFQEDTAKSKDRTNRL